MPEGATGPSTGDGSVPIARDSCLLAAVLRPCKFDERCLRAPNVLGVSCTAGPAWQRQSGAAVAADDVRSTEWRTATAVTPPRWRQGRQLGCRAEAGPCQLHTKVRRRLGTRYWSESPQSGQLSCRFAQELQRKWPLLHDFPAATSLRLQLSHTRYPIRNPFLNANHAGATRRRPRHHRRTRATR